MDEVQADFGFGCVIPGVGADVGNDNDSATAFVRISIVEMCGGCNPVPRCWDHESIDSSMYHSRGREAGIWGQRRGDIERAEELKKRVFFLCLR